MAKNIASEDKIEELRLKRVARHVAAYRSRIAKAGLKRVEVYVPEDKVELLKAYAKELKDGQQSVDILEIRKLLKLAHKRYKAKHLDNISIDVENAGFREAAIVAAALKHGGDKEAYKLGLKISRMAK